MQNKNNEFKNKAIELFIDKTKYSKDQIKQINKIENGFSNNANFLFLLDNGDKFQVKIPKGKNTLFPDIKSAFLYDSSIYIYLNENGLMIKKWIEGKHVDFSEEKHARWVLDEIQKLHNIKIESNEMGMYDINAYRKKTNIPTKFLKEFDVLSTELQKYEISFIHGDINPKNVLVTKSRALLIDFEWSKNGYSILDYAYLIAFSKININLVSKVTNYNVQELEKMVRFVLIHTLMWCENEQTDKSSILSKEIMEKLQIN
ncbi:phosphotransferase [Mycoplasma marinum]|uniref:Ternary complex associated domain-containing protein n=1 Tax=Mycoplasma marinum TaxID=1937190 RepID=A0A4R0XPY0_9MOLU|nr:phosphotransferase [Mycoplasma marinum]TCG10935.1 hypothetical protein C4B24_03430 [Mycoplasma marinum]